MDAKAWANRGAAEQLLFLDEDEVVDLRFVSALMRAAYGQGYVHALAEEPPLTVDQAVRNRETLYLSIPVSAEVNR